MAAAHGWGFRSRFRRDAFGWSGTRKAIERIREAVGEIERMAHVDPVLAGEGAVLLLEKLSPALRSIDSSSGALGNATAGVVETLVPLIVTAPAPARLREKWLDRLFDALQEDDPPYIESLGAHWGALCGTAELASQWADQLLPSVRGVMAARGQGSYAFTSASTPCYSALLHARRLDELIGLLAQDRRPFWHDQQWAARALAAQGNVDGALGALEGLRGPHTPERALAAIAEELLLSAGRAEEAYARYAIRATSAQTNIAMYRALVKRYPSVAPDRVLADLIASSPGEEGKWFATAKTLKQYALAQSLAWRAPVDPKTLLQAARDHVKGHPAFALEVALAALHWLARGVGYEVTAGDVVDARDYALSCAAALGDEASVHARIEEQLATSMPSSLWVRRCLGLDAS